MTPPFPVGLPLAAPRGAAFLPLDGGGSGGGEKVGQVWNPGRAGLPRSPSPDPARQGRGKRQSPTHGQRRLGFPCQDALANLWPGNDGCARHPAMREPISRVIPSFGLLPTRKTIRSLADRRISSASPGFKPLLSEAERLLAKTLSAAAATQAPLKDERAFPSKGSRGTAPLRPLPVKAKK